MDKSPEVVAKKAAEEIAASIRMLGEADPRQIEAIVYGAIMYAERTVPCGWCEHGPK